MALIKCGDCGSKMRNKASECPNCASSARPQRSGLVYYLGKHLILLAGVFWIGSLFIDAVSEFGESFAPLTAHARQPEKQSYTIIREENVPGEKRSVDVLLEHKISEDQLKLLARRIMTMKGPPPERTFISYYVSWQSGSPHPWATTHFDPDLEIRIADDKQSQVDPVSAEKTARSVTDVAQTNP